MCCIFKMPDFSKVYQLPCAASSAPGLPVHLAPDRTFAERRPLVVELLAARQADLDLGPASFEVQAQRNQGQPLLADLSPEPCDLSLVKEELPVALGIVVGVGAVAIGIDVASEEPTLSIPDGRIAILEVDHPVPERFDLGPAQYQPGLDRLEDLVLVTGAAIGRDRTVARRLGVLTCHVRKVL